MSSNHLTGLVMATLLEAEPLIMGLELKQVEKPPFLCYRNDDTVMVISGIGKANAAMATVYLHQKYCPDVICNAGAAGALVPSLALGAAYHIHYVIEPDRPMLSSKEPHVYTPYLLEGFRTASLATRDRPVITLEERQALSLKADLADMEAASVLQACKRLGVPCPVFKFVSDTPEHAEHGQIIDNIRTQRDSFYQFYSASIAPQLKTISI